ncbi:MAG: hypothetical protein EA365_06595 [Gloeocapsa sp. DLM2.Bin57]|nr:MAG: hypothetical protein EA365_06595 [Gloeocapsa sp. DLM2.Bin57]
MKYIIITIILGLNTTQSALSLPDPEDIPEEVLRTEIVLEGRSPIDGEPVTLTEYVELRNQISQSRFPPNLDPEIRHQVFLLELLKFLRIFTPL